MAEETKKAVKPTLKKNAEISVDADLMKKHQQMVNFLRNEISGVEIELKKMKVILDQLVNFDPLNPKSLEVAAETQEALNAQDLNTYSEE